jgi:peptidoglycan hydrolase-like protein with peptidoglycan-binding domain
MMSKPYVFSGALALVLGSSGTALATGEPGAADPEPKARNQQTSAPEQSAAPQHDTGSSAEQQSAASSAWHDRLSADQRKQLQRKLQERGHYQGSIDGVVGPQTRAALRQFQEQEGLGASGELSQETIASLGLTFDERQPVSGADSDADSEVQRTQGTEAISGEPAQAFQLSALSETQVRELQTKLQSLGHYRGQVDGKVGPMTRSALRRYFDAQAALAARSMLSESALNVFGIDASEIQPVKGQDEAGQPSQQQPSQQRPSQQRPSQQQPSQQQPSQGAPAPGGEMQ